MADKGKFDAGAFTAAASQRKAAGKADFGHDADVKSGRANGIHKDLDPKWVAGPTSPLAGQNVRECRDSKEHPTSLPIAVFFDVTGSMGEIPRVLQQKLPNLMDTLIAKAGVKHPQLLVGAIGDIHARNGSLENGDMYPFKVSQFEADNKIDDQLRSIIIEGGGQAQKMECYGYAYRFAAYHTATDACEKRGKKGYLVTIGD